MRVLCCLDGTNVRRVSKASEILSANQQLTLGIIYVIDTGPRKDIEHTRERFLRPTGPPGPREREMQQAEHAAAEDILNEGLRYLPNAEALQRQARPEREIVNIAAEWQADLVILFPRAEYGGKPTFRPKTSGATRRVAFRPSPCPP